MKRKLLIVLAVILTLTLSLTSVAFAAGGEKEVTPAQMVLDASLSEVSTAFNISKENLEAAESRAFSFGDDKFLLSSIVDKESQQAYMVSTDAQGKVWIAEPKIEGELIDYMLQMKPDETVLVDIWAIYVSPEEELWQIPSKYPDVPFEGYYPALGADVSPEILDAIEADATEIKLKANKEAVQPVVDFLQSTGSKIIYVSLLAPTVDAELSKNDIYELARLPEVESISLPDEPEPCMDTAAYTIKADEVWDEGYDGGMSDGSGSPTGTQTKVAVVDYGIDWRHPCLSHAYEDDYEEWDESVTDHGTNVAGCIASNHATHTGIAYGTKILDANFGGTTQSWSRLKYACDWAWQNGADVFTHSYKWGAADGQWDNKYCKYFDHIAYVWSVLPVKSAGNKGQAEEYCTSPANAWNVLAVGGIYDKNTASWSDDIMYNSSSWRNPETPHNDREKPEVCAPAQSIITTEAGTSEVPPTYDSFGSHTGTSFAAPQVAGIAALLIEKNQSLKNYPALLKAIIMATANHNVEPNPSPDRPVDDKEGVGTVNAWEAYKCVDQGWIWWGDKVEADLPFDIPFYAEAGETVRFVISWYAHTDYSGDSYYGNGLCADLKLDILDWAQSYNYGTSNSYDSGWEVVQFTAPYSGTYYAEVSAPNHGEGDPWTYYDAESIAAAWYRSSEATTLELVPETGTNPVGEDHNLTATVYDQFGHEMEGVAVTWSIESGPGSFVYQDTTTDADGRANAVITSSFPGTSTVKCEMPGIMQVGAGSRHTVGLNPDGTVVAVGENSHGECEVGDWTDITQVAAGGDHTVGLKSDGTVVAVGWNIQGECEVGGWTDIVQVSAGFHYTVGLRSDGTVVAVGSNTYGQCDVGGWTDITQVAAGDFHTVGLKSDGTVVAVGWNYPYGQCEVGGWTDITQVTAGGLHTVGLKYDGTVVAVGYNLHGQCEVSGWTVIVQVAAGTYHTVGLKSYGAVVAVGDNSYGECDVGGWTGIVQVAAGSRHTVGPKSDGTVVAVGDNSYGECDVGGWRGTVYDTATKDWTYTPEALELVPETGTNPVGEDHNLTATVYDQFGHEMEGVAVTWSIESGPGSFVYQDTTTDADGRANAVITSSFPGTSTVKCEMPGIMQVGAGSRHTVGLNPDGTVVAVGENSHGECEVGDWTDITQVAAGGDHTVGLKSDGTVVAVGWNIQGECEVGGWTDIVQVSAGFHYTVGLRSDGTVVAVGSNTYGQCDVGGWTDITQVAAGDFHTVGLKSDGTVVAVGWNYPYGQCEVGGWTDITQVTAGGLHTVGLKYDGTVVAVGYNLHGQCEVSGWTVIVQVAAGTYHTVGLKSYGAVVAVGDNSYGECDVGGWTGIVQVAAGSRHTVGPKSDGTVVAVGDNSYGECDVGGWRGTVYDTATKDWTYTPEATTLELLPETGTNPVGEDHNLTATVYDQFGYVMEGVDVTWNITGVGSFSGTPESPTDADGRANAVITSSFPGTSTVKCEVTGNPSVYDTATKDWTYTPEATTLELFPETGENSVDTTHELTATVYDQFGYLMEYVAVTWSIGGVGSFSGTPESPTDANGQANAVITSSAPGESTVRCEVTGNPSVYDTATKDWTYTPEATTLELFPETGENSVDTTHNLTATVYDQFGYLMEYVAVTWSIGGVGSFSGTPEGVTDANGQADAVITSSFPGTSTVKCEVTGDPTTYDTAAKDWTYTPEATTLELLPETGENPVDTTHDITATVYDQFGYVMEGLAVTWTIESGPGSFVSQDTTTDVNGEADAVITSGFPGTSTVRCEVTGNPSVYDTATKDWTYTPEATTLELLPEAGENPVDTTHNLTATLYDQFGYAMDGVDVTWNIIGVGTFSGTPEGVTDVNGEADAVITSSFPGASTVRCEVTGNPSVSDTAAKDWTYTPEATTLELLPETGENPVDTTHNLTATVYDQFGYVMEGLAVTWNISGVGSFGTPEGVTDANGQADAVITSSFPGTSTVRCEVTGNPSVYDTATKDWTYTPEATTLELLPEAGGNPVDTTHNLTATVYDQFGYVMEGVAVTWTIESDPGSFVSQDTTTDVNGQADAVITSIVLGTSTVRCEVTGNPSVYDNATKDWTYLEDFEWGNDGDSLEPSGGFVEWTVETDGSSVAQIDTAQAHSGTRSGRFYYDGSSDKILAYYSQDSPEWRGFYLMKDKDAVPYTITGDGTNTVFVRVKQGQWLQYYDGSWHNVCKISDNTWHFIEFRNIDWTAATYDIYVDDHLESSDTPMSASTSYNGVTAYYGSDSTQPSEFWIDDILK
jgi:alpha-tubulin suppressor-like RCC1 family protein